MGSLQGQAFGQVTAKVDASVIIVGAGFSGMAMAIEMQKAGIDFLILEKGNEFGGTWRDNVYPGAACDVPSHMYCFSFEPYRWSRSYAKQPEILDYQKFVAKKHNLYRDTRFKAEVSEAVYDDVGNFWTVKTKGGQEYRARILVSARGAIHIPTYPNLPGLHDYKGIKMHSAEWDHSIDLTGKKIALIGTGASAIQIVPELAKVAGQLTVFQRTPAWVLPKLDYPYKEKTQEWMEKQPLLRWLHRKQIYWTLEATASGFVIDPRLMKAGQLLAQRYLKTVQNPATRKALTPNYTMGCKRILMSNDYLQAFNLPNVELVGPVEAMTETAVVAGGKAFDADVIVFCTGFDVTGIGAQFPMTGKNHIEIGHHWKDGMSAYLGIMTENFPNAFFMTGPNTALGHNSIILMIEAQANYIAQALKYMQKNNVERLEVKPEAEQAFNDDVQGQMQRSVWSSGCASWYLDENGRNTTIWPSFTFNYILKTMLFKPSMYDATTADGQPPKPGLVSQLLSKI